MAPSLETVFTVALQPHRDRAFHQHFRNFVATLTRTLPRQIFMGGQHVQIKVRKNDEKEGKRFSIDLARKPNTIRYAIPPTCGYPAAPRRNSRSLELSRHKFVRFLRHTFEGNINLNSLCFNDFTFLTINLTLCFF